MQGLKSRRIFKHPLLPVGPERTCGFPPLALLRISPSTQALKQASDTDHLSTTRTACCLLIHHSHKPSNKVQTAAICDPAKASPELVNYCSLCIILHLWCHYSVIHHQHKPLNKLQTLTTCHLYIGHFACSFTCDTNIGIRMRFTHRYEVLPKATVLSRKGCFQADSCKNNTFNLLLRSVS